MEKYGEKEWNKYYQEIMLPKKSVWLYYNRLYHFWCQSWQKIYVSYELK